MIKATRLEGLSYWGEYQPERGIDFNGFHWQRAQGGVLIDPMPLDAEGVAKLKELGGARWILITNAEHLRAGVTLKQAFGAKLLAPTQERERLGDKATEVDEWFEDQSSLPEDLRDDVQVFALLGGKSPMEPALYLEPLGAFYFADLVRCHQSGRPRLLPEPKLSDKAQVISSLQALPELSIEALLFGDGDGIYNGAEATFQSFIEELN
ncbi:MAG: hypothetical protein ACI8X5_003759 [Planctomycetota bacterium]|jgi:hypothetical protein